MIPYDGFLYFTFLLYPLAIAIVLGLVGALRPLAVVILSVGVLLFQFADPVGNLAQVAAGWSQLHFLLLYVSGILLVVYGFAWVRSHTRLRLWYYAAVLLVLLPLAAVKVQPILADYGLWGSPATVAAHSRGSAHSPAASGPAGNTPSPAATAPTPVGHQAPASGKTRASQTQQPPANLLPTRPEDIIGFLGISYLTFRVLDLVILLEDRVVTGLPNLSDLLAYLLFFPTISAGPIDRYQRFVADLHDRPRRSRYLLDIEAGIHRIMQGFLYKYILAFLIYQHWLSPAAREPGLPGMISYMYAYTFYLFFDFAGYSAFAIGTGRFLGIRVPENFAAPFLSANFRDVWNRWHITLSWWLRDHVYMRFVLGAVRRKRFGGNRHAASYVGFLLTMGLMGLWHGLYANYILYGVYQGVMLVVYDFLGRWNKRRRLLPVNGWTKAVSVVVTFHLFAFGLLIFSGHLIR